MQRRDTDNTKTPVLPSKFRNIYGIPSWSWHNLGKQTLRLIYAIANLDQSTTTIVTQST